MFLRDLARKSGVSEGVRALTEEGKCEITLGYEFVRQLEPLIVYHICARFAI